MNFIKQLYKFAVFLMLNMSVNAKGNSKVKLSELQNGHQIEKLENLEYYKGKSEKQIIFLLGKPFKIPEKPNVLYYFVLNRKILALIPFKGGIVDGTILILELNEKGIVTQARAQNYEKHKPINHAKIRIKEKEKEKKKLEQKIKKAQQERYKKEFARQKGLKKEALKRKKAEIKAKKEALKNIKK